MHRVIFILVLLICAPLRTHGAILINEIAWMGTDIGPNEEWIELYNNGTEVVSVDGWILTDNVSLEIELTGTIGVGEYAVLERSDDETVAGTAFLIYTGALSNDGRTLTLKRSDDEIEDQVAGGSGWIEVGGSNETKDTAQRTLHGWITGVPTPGAENTSVQTVVPAEEESSENDEVPANTSTTKSSGGKKATPSKSTTITAEDTVLTLTLNAPSVAYVNQVVDFEIVPKGAGRSLMNSLVYYWNFGDTYTGQGKRATHAFAYPGEYVVFVEASFAERKAEIRHEITVLPIMLTLARTDGGDIMIHNNAKYEVDISEYILGGNSYFTIPRNTILKPMGTLTLSASRVSATTGTVISLYGSERNFITSTLVTKETVAIDTMSTPIAYAEVGDTETELASERMVSDIPSPIRIGSQGANIEEHAVTYTSDSVLIGAIGLLCVGILALYISRLRSPVS